MYKDFADFITVLLEKGVLDKNTAVVVTENYLVKEQVLSEEEADTLKNLREYLEQQQAAALELAQGT